MREVVKFGKFRGLGKFGFTEEEYNNIIKLFLGLRLGLFCGL